MADQNIGAARVHLVVDATDWDSTLAQARNAAAQFGTDAERAFEKSEGGVRRAATRLLDYAASLGRVDTQMERYIRNASRAGVEEPIIRAAIARWEEYQKEIMSTTAALEEAARIDKAFDQARAESAQRAITTQVAPGLERDAAEQARRRADAEAALLPVLQQQEAAYEQMVRSQYDQLNALLGVADAGRDTSDQARRRADAEAALLPLLQEQERQYSDMLNLAHRINDARDEAMRNAAQQDMNALLGVDDTTAEQRVRRQADARAALTDIIEKEIAAEQKLQATRQQGEQFLSYLKNLGDTAGKTHYEILELKAAQLGISAEAAPMIQAIKDQNAAMGAGTLSAKQYEWAMRGLPAQLTDISVGLATGQKPWMVFLQQGGQLKDMFGGIVPAAKAVGGAVWGMINPITVAGAAIGALAIGAYQGSKEIGRLENALIITGNRAQLSAGQLSELTRELAELDGANIGRATDVVAEAVRASGLVGEQIELASRAAILSQRALGTEVSETIDTFKRLADEPVNALIDLNEEYGFLSQKQLEQIELLVKQEDHTKAGTEAMRLFADMLAQRTPEMTENLGYVERGWRAIKDAAVDAWDWIKSAGRAATSTELVEQIHQLEKFQQYYKERGTTDLMIEQKLAEARSKLVGLAVDEAFAIQSGTDVTKRGFKERKDAQQEWERIVERGLSDEARLLKEIEDIRATGNKLKLDEVVIEEQVAAARERAAKRGRGSQGRDGTAAIREAAQAEIAAITTQTRLLQQQYDQRAITVEDYYDKLGQFADEEIMVTLRSIEAQKAAVAGRKDASQRIEQLESQAARAREQHVQREIELDEQRRRAVQQREIAFRDYVRSLDDANEAAQRDADLAVARVSMGAKEFERMSALNDLLRRRTELEEELDRRVADGSLNPDDALRYRDALERVNEQVRILTEGWDRVDEAQGSFLNGAARAWKDWYDQVSDVSQSGYDLLTSAVSGFADSVAETLNGNLGTWESYFESLHMQILKFIAEQQLTKWMKQLGEALSGNTSEGMWGSIARGIGDLFSGATANAHGGVYSSPGLSAYRNSIVSQPTFFPFARGGVPNIGLMGERSGKPHEAIMPLIRTAGGDLGVKAVESGRNGPITLNQTYVVQGTPDRTTREQLAKQTGRETSRAMSRT